MENDLVQLVAKLQRDPVFYFNNCLKIQEFGTGELIPFELNEVQAILHKMMQRQVDRDEHVRMIVLKARRFGISCLLYTSPSPRDKRQSRMPSSA